MMTTRSTMENRDKDCASVMDDNEEDTAKQPNVSTYCLSVSHLSYSLNFVFSDSASSVLFIHQWIADISREQRKQSVTKAISRTMTEANLCFAMLLTEHSLRFAWQGHENNTTRDVCISQMEKKERYIASNWRLREEWLMSQKMRWEISDSKMLSWKDSLSQCARSSAVWEIHWRSSRRLRFRCKW